MSNENVLNFIRHTQIQAHRLFRCKINFCPGEISFEFDRIDVCVLSQKNFFLYFSIEKPSSIDSTNRMIQQICCCWYFIHTAQRHSTLTAHHLILGLFYSSRYVLIHFNNVYSIPVFFPFAHPSNLVFLFGNEISIINIVCVDDFAPKSFCMVELFKLIYRFNE